jgi:putative membrane protein
MLRRLLITTIVIIVAGFILPGIQVNSLLTALVVAVVLIILNTILRPILIFLTLPVTIITLGLFLFVINIFVIFLTDLLVPGFTVQNWLWALIFSLIVSLVNSIFEENSEVVK